MKSFDKRQLLILWFCVIQLAFCSGKHTSSKLVVLSKKSKRQRRRSRSFTAKPTAVITSTCSERKTQEMRGGDTSEEPAMSRFTKVRRTIFPIYGKTETTKFLLMGSMKFFIIMALTLTRDTKDTLIVTQCGAEAIAFLKVRTIQHVSIWLFFLFKTHISHQISFSSLLDLWSSSGSHSFHCSLFQHV